MVRESVSVRKVAKRLLRPLWARAWARVEHRVQPIEAAIDDLSKDLSNLDRRLAALENGWRQHVPGLLNAMSSIAAFGYELAALRREMQTKPDEGIRPPQRELGTLDSDRRGATERVNTEIRKLWKSAEHATTGIEELRQRIEAVRQEIMNLKLSRQQ